MEDSRVNQVNKFTCGLADIQIGRHPLRQNVVLIFNSTDYDIYRDATTVEETRINKLCIVERDKDLFYIQELLGDDFLVDDNEMLPWIITMTITDLPRILKQDDVIIIDDLKFTVSRVKPINQRLNSVLTVLAYPERTDTEDTLDIIDVIVTVDGLEVESLYEFVGEEVLLEVVYGGKPLFRSFDGTTWEPFEYKFKYTPLSIVPVTLSIKDITETVVTFDIL